MIEEGVAPRRENWAAQSHFADSREWPLATSIILPVPHSHASLGGSRRLVDSLLYSRHSSYSQELPHPVVGKPVKPETNRLGKGSGVHFDVRLSSCCRFVVLLV